MGSLVSAREARQLRRRARRQAMPRMVTWTALLGLGLLAVHLGWYSSESGGVVMHGEGATRKLLQVPTVAPTASTTAPTASTTAPTASTVSTAPTASSSNSSSATQLYPNELFTFEEKKAGGPIVLYIMGVLYMFVFLSIVCDEFFVPALEVVIERFDISDDVAGATLMAAGGSAPELFTSLIGVFFAKSGSVGFGTIIGSAVFNVLFVIGMCAIFSLDVLELTWWPLARDCSWYTLDLVVLYLCFRDKQIELWESALLLALYLCYVAFMKFNTPAERFIKGLLGQKIVPVETRYAKEVDAKEEAASAASSVRASPNATHPEAVGGETVGSPLAVGGRRPSGAGRRTSFDYNDGVVYSPGSALAMNEVKGAMGMSMSTLLMRGGSVKNVEMTESDLGVSKIQRRSVVEAGVDPAALQALEENNSLKEEEAEEDNGLDLSWPEGVQNQVVFVLVAPILFALAWTVPDVRKEGKADFWWLSFLLSIMWIGVSSYLMVWWATVVGSVVGMPDEVMGYTFLAAGTSVPDLMSSVIVAKQGLGDMAVSSSIGSNIFDITFGLPLPWFIWILANNNEPYVVESKSLTFSLVLLIIMLVFVVVSIAAAGWKMSKRLGGVMFALYGVFLALVLLKSANMLGALNDV